MAEIDNNTQDIEAAIISWLERMAEYNSRIEVKRIVPRKIRYPGKREYHLICYYERKIEIHSDYAEWYQATLAEFPIESTRFFMSEKFEAAAEGIHFSFKQEDITYLRKKYREAYNDFYRKRIVYLKLLGYLALFLDDEVAKSSINVTNSYENPKLTVFKNNATVEFLTDLNNPSLLYLQLPKFDTDKLFELLNQIIIPALSDANFNLRDPLPEKYRPLIGKLKIDGLEKKILETIIKAVHMYSKMVSSTDSIEYRGKPFMAAEEAADYLSVELRTIRDYCSKNLIKHYKTRGRKVYFLRTDLDNFVINEGNLVKSKSQIEEEAKEYIRKTRSGG